MHFQNAFKILSQRFLKRFVGTF